MRIMADYSHLFGKEFLLVHQKQIWDEITDAIESVDAKAYCTRKIANGLIRYAPSAMNKYIAENFVRYGWEKHHRQNFSTTSDARLLRTIAHLPQHEQRKAIEAAGHRPINSYYETDFIKNRISVEVQFASIESVSHDVFVKHPSLYISGMIDVGVEIVPMKELQRNMSSSEGYYEASLFNILRQGRNIPAVPLVIIGIAP